MTNNSNPLVTIVTVTYNLIEEGRKEYFKQCLESVHNQTYKNIEHIVIDGASNDGTVELIKEYADKGWVKYISEKDNGIYDAMNKGIKIAKGKYIAFLNSDDYYHNVDAVKMSVEKLEEENADFSYADFILKDDNNDNVVEGDISKFIYTMPFGHPTMFTKVAVMRKEGSFDEQYGLPADYDFIIKIILKDYKHVKIDKSIVTYRVGGLGCVTEHSDKIAQIYYDRYSAFYDFSSVEQAKKIMYELKLPKNFIAKFRLYADNKKYKNLNIDSVISNLINKLREEKDKNDTSLKPFKDGIPIFLSSDNNYAPFVATTALSILQHTQSNINFYILDGGITYNNAKKIKEDLSIFSNHYIEFIEIDVEDKFKNFPTRLHFSIDMYTRFLIPELKSEFKKVIYSDVDVIFNKDIKYLFEEDLDGKIIGAVPYTFGYLNPNKNEINSYHERLDLPSSHKYFESGLLLIDAESWRKGDFTNKLIEEVRNNKSDRILTPDQDVFNIIFNNSYKELSNKYIVVPHREDMMKTSIEANKTIQNPFIFHYAGADKPWLKPNMYLSEHFWKYAKMTSFYESLILRICNHNKSDGIDLKCDVNEENKKIKNSKTYRLGDLFFRSVKKPYKLITYPYNFVKILLDK